MSSGIQLKSKGLGRSSRTAAKDTALHPPTSASLSQLLQKLLPSCSAALLLFLSTELTHRACSGSPAPAGWFAASLLPWQPQKFRTPSPFLHRKLFHPQMTKQKEHSGGCTEERLFAEAPFSSSQHPQLSRSQHWMSTSPARGRPSGKRQAFEHQPWLPHSLRLTPPLRRGELASRYLGRNAQTQGPVSAPCSL